MSTGTLSERLEAMLDIMEVKEDASVTEDDAARVFVPMTPAAFMALIAEAVDLAERFEVAPAGSIVGVDFQSPRPQWSVMDDRDSVPLGIQKRVRLVPEKPVSEAT